MAKKFFRKIGKGVKKVASNRKVRRFVVKTAKKAARSPAVRNMVVGGVRKLGGRLGGARVGNFAATELEKQLKKI